MTPRNPEGFEGLADAVLAASRVLVAVAARSLADHEGGLSIQQFRSLVVLSSRRSMRPVDLASALGVDSSTVTRLCDRLVRKGVISRQRDETDRREVHLALTGAGRELVDTVTERRYKEILRILQAVPSSERTGLLRAFSAFSAAAGEASDEGWTRVWEL